MSLMHRIQRIELELGISPDDPAPVSIVQTFAIRTVARHVCREMNQPFERVLSNIRERPLFHARAAISWIARERLHRSFPAIGRVLNVDHSSVIHQFDRAQLLIASDPAFRQVVDIVSRRLFSRPVA